MESITEVSERIQPQAQAQPVDVVDTSSDNDVDYDNVFNLREYEKNEQAEYGEYRRTYAYALRDRYLETIDRRRQKMILHNLSVLDGLSGTMKTTTLRQQPEQQQQPKPDTTPFSWKAIAPPVVVEPTSVELGDVTEKNMQQQPAAATKKPRRKNVENTVSDEEMATTLARHSKSPGRHTSKSPGDRRVDANPQKRSDDRRPDTMHRQRVDTSKSPDGNRDRRPDIDRRPDGNRDRRPDTDRRSDAPTKPEATFNNAKTRMCNFAGKCRRSNCTYAHTLDEFSPVECRFHTCRKPDCRFFHPKKESKSDFLERFRSMQQQ